MYFTTLKFVFKNKIYKNTIFIILISLLLYKTINAHAMKFLLYYIFMYKYILVYDNKNLCINIYKFIGTYTKSTVYNIS